MGVRTDVPTPGAPPADVRAPKKAKGSAMGIAFEAASRANKFQEVSPAKAKSLETQFNDGSAKTEDLSGGRVGASIQGMVLKGELFVRTKAVRPGVSPKWASAGAVKGGAQPKASETAPAAWGPKPKSLEARVQKVVAERMGMMSHPDMALNATETAGMKKAIADGEFQKVSASPKGLAGVALTGYVQDNILIVEKKAVAPGAKPAFFYLGPIN